MLACDGTYLPIEVKWTEAPDAGDARHLNCFLKEYPTFGKGYIICRVPQKIKISDQVMALPWQTFLDEIAAAIAPPGSCGGR